MIRSFFTTLNVVAALICAFPAMGADYTDGIIVVNESQYGKGSGSLNYLLPENKSDYWKYRVFRAENPGKELGCTSTYGAYHYGRLYIISKLAKDPGSSVTGGIVTVMDGETLEWKGQIDALDPSGKRVCGRAFIGIDRDKGYVSSSNGIWVVDLGTLDVKGMIKGTENPYGVDDKPVGDPTSALYFGQCGSMVASGGKVFAAHQSKGLLVIDPVKDSVIDVITMDFVAEGAGVGSVIKAKDGSLWVSVTQNIDGDGVMCNSIVRVDAESLQTTEYVLPDGIYPPSASWASWSADTFCASQVDDLLFWTGGSTSWFANKMVFKYDMKYDKFSCLIDFDDDDDQWKVCCPSLRVSPIDGSLYMTLFKDVVSTQYTVRNYDIQGNELRDFPMERGYWFAGMMLFPQVELSGIENVVAEHREENMHVLYKNGTLSVMMRPDMVYNTFGDAVICDLSGRVISKLNISDSEFTIHIPLPEGVYVFAYGSEALKFVVK